MKIDILDKKGKSVKQIELDKSIFEIEVNNNILSQYVYVYLSNQRQSNAHTKDRSEVRGGGRKPYKQKGTGKARFGSSRNPIWKGGGVSMGPTNDINWKKSLTKKFKKVAFKHALSKLVNENALKVIEGLEIKGDVKLTNTGVSINNIVAKDAKKTLFVTANKNEKALQAFANVPNVRVTNTNEVNVYDLLNGGTVVFDEEAIQSITEKLTK